MGVANFEPTIVAGNMERFTSRLLHSQVQGVLATWCAMNKRPATHLMAFGCRSDLTHVFLATSLNTVKAQNMQMCPAVSMLWDDRTGKLSDHGDGGLVTARATARILRGDVSSEARKLFLLANPNMVAFVHDASTAMFELKIEEYSVVVGYGESQQWSPTHGAASL